MKDMDINSVLKLCLGMDESGGYMPGNCEERIKEAFPDSYTNVFASIKKYLEYDLVNVFEHESLEELGNAYLSSFSKAFPEIEPTVAKAMANRFSYSWR